ncbi:hypothetical protein WH47_07834 [Habropoda laboriosa]|uniref:Uncharacterized protein n=1 Tax=Habropoda laboriosa TaxID=597456 RepID=A0A0L7QPS0_9HYME|nr:PREDICTED: uncharacterized protein LOC108576765 [Habropoda laboriosa]KOC60476.1 hypothetical protein WH47_07834 [Habropoda laboriosa]
MIDFKSFDRGCMKFGALKKSRKLWRIKGVEPPKIEVCEGKAATISVKEEIAELLFENCSDCIRMAAIPQGVFAACKVRNNHERNVMIRPMEEREKGGKENIFNMRPPLEGWELTPLKYNSKLMNSIWGLYNRYSVHNFKKNTDADEGVFGRFVAVSRAIFHCHEPAANTVTAATAVVKNNS